jgi:hypothetical protein
MQICLLAVALVIDVMKAASLGFVVPGMRVEYGLSFSAVAVLPFVALLGTTVGRSSGERSPISTAAAPPFCWPPFYS